DAPAPQKRSTASAADARQKLYGDTFVSIIQFPALEKGAVIEIEYKKESQVENEYADYFGDQFYIGDPAFEPTLHSEYVLITPKNREFYWDYTAPDYPETVDAAQVNISPEPEITENDDTRTWHWSFSHLPTLSREP